ncbi:hypothetical protein [Pseudoalteromonas rubra]|uniref:hypothetical protein n=1 Tax=Pseudoalteromonas rubra TaxID=43658 RepID=UPI002DBCC52A|nr:hypothetical protein [Pseudoalteromonas rubra]MEC4090123.1 hypothetical protein [Pseudoalteromonas rubra]
MSAKDVFVENMVTVLGKSKVKELVRQANEQGVAIDYTYFMDVRRGSRNPSVDKLEQIVATLQLLPGFGDIELWMFFVPGYFEQQSVKQSGTNPPAALTEQEFVGKVADALMMYHYFDWVKIDNDKMDFDAAGKYMLKQVGPLVGVSSSMDTILDKFGNQ